MSKVIYKLLIVMVFFSVTNLTYASDLKHKKSNINFKMENVSGKDIINYADTIIDPESIDVLIVLNGKIITSSHGILQGTSSLIPINFLSSLSDVKLEWNESSSSVLINSGNNKMLMVIDEDIALINGEEVSLSFPPKLINSTVYVPSRVVLENINCEFQFNDDIIFFYDKEGNSKGMSVLSIEQTSENIRITENDATDMLRRKIKDMFYENYKGTKRSQDIDIFLEMISYKSLSTRMNRFYKIEVKFYDNWNKVFKSYGYVDKYTGQMYLGDYEYGLTEDMLTYFVNKYEKDLVIENKPTKLMPFSEMEIIKDDAFIYVNFPERIQGNALLETYYNYVNKVKGTGRVFVSQKNMSKHTIDYIIRFKNESNEDVLLSIYEDGAIHNTEEYQDKIIREHISRFYNKKLLNENFEIELVSGEVYDVRIKNIEDEQFFTGMIDFDASNDVSITAFAVKSTERDNYIPSPTMMYDYTYIPKTYFASEESLSLEDSYYTTYSGVGEGYKIEIDGAVKASDMVKVGRVGEDWNIGFETGGSHKNINEHSGLKEIIEIILTADIGRHNEINKAIWRGNVLNIKDDMEDRLNKNIKSNYGNLGNWGIEYIITMELTNDTSTEKVFSCNLVPPEQTTFAYLVDGELSVSNINNKKYSSTIDRKERKDYEQIYIGSGIRSNKVTSVTLKPNETKKVTYTYILGTDCESTMYHIWTCVDAK